MSTADVASLAARTRAQLEQLDRVILPMFIQKPAWVTKRDSDELSRLWVLITQLLKLSLWDRRSVEAEIKKQGVRLGVQTATATSVFAATPYPGLDLEISFDWAADDRSVFMTVDTHILNALQGYASNTLCAKGFARASVLPPPFWGLGPWMTWTAEDVKLIRAKLSLLKSMWDGSSSAIPREILAQIVWRELSSTYGPEDIWSLVQSAATEAERNRVITAGLKQFRFFRDMLGADSAFSYIGLSDVLRPVNVAQLREGQLDDAARWEYGGDPVLTFGYLTPGFLAALTMMYCEDRCIIMSVYLQPTVALRQAMVNARGDAYYAEGFRLFDRLSGELGSGMHIATSVFEKIEDIFLKPKPLQGLAAAPRDLETARVISSAAADPNSLQIQGLPGLPGSAPNANSPTPPEEPSVNDNSKTWSQDPTVKLFLDGLLQAGHYNMGMASTAALRASGEVVVEALLDKNDSAVVSFLQTPSGKRLIELLGAGAMHAMLTHTRLGAAPGADMAVKLSADAVHGHLIVGLHEHMPDPEVMIKRLTGALKDFLASAKKMQDTAKLLQDGSVLDALFSAAAPEAVTVNANNVKEQP